MPYVTLHNTILNTNYFSNKGDCSCRVQMGILSIVSTSTSNLHLIIQHWRTTLFRCIYHYSYPLCYLFSFTVLLTFTMQMKPSIDLQAEKSDGRTESSRPAIQQTWQKSGSCPKGTIPIRRIRRQDLIRAASVKEFGRKAPQISRGANRTNPKQSQYQPNEPKVQFPPVPNRSVSTL